MRKLALIMVVLSAGMLFINPVKAPAHGKNSHDGDEQMKKLHNMMPVFSVALAECDTALINGDVAAAKAPADKIMAAAPDLKRCKPHKNVKQRKKFVELATYFEESVSSTVALIKKDDLSGAKAALKKVEEACTVCHSKFRD